jgi:hypothetical protein
MGKETYMNITNPTNFHVQVMANSGWRVLAAGEDTDAIVRSDPNGPKAANDGECYRAIYAPDGGEFIATPLNLKGDVINAVVLEGFQIPGIFKRIQNTGAVTIYISIA